MCLIGVAAAGVLTETGALDALGDGECDGVALLDVPGALEAPGDAPPEAPAPLPGTVAFGAGPNDCVVVPAPQPVHRMTASSNRAVRLTVGEFTSQGYPNRRAASLT